MVFNIKRVSVAVICAVFIFGFSVVSTVTADVNPFATSDSGSFIKLVGCGDAKCGGEGKCGGAGKCGSADKSDDESSDDSDDGKSDDSDDSKSHDSHKSDHADKSEHKCGGEGKCGS